MIKYLLSFIVLLFIQTVIAQTPDQRPSYGLVKGVVVDAKTEEALPFVSVVIYKLKDTSIVDGILTDEQGQFKFNNIQQGNYIIRLSYVGYVKKWSMPFSIVFGRPITDLGKLKFEKPLTALEQVEIVAEKKQVDYSIDKIVINVEQNPALTGGSAADALQTVPAVNVDMDGNVSMRGSANVTILIDGRPSTYTSVDQISASMIERIEILTNPSAKYDPEGTVGIINIIMKQKAAKGLNGMITLNAGTNDKYNGSININYKKNKLNTYLNIDARVFHMDAYTDVQRTTTLADTVTHQIQERVGRMKGQFSNFKAGVDYQLNKLNTLSVSTSLGLRDFYFRENNFNRLTSEDNTVLDLYNRYSKRETVSNSGDITINYKRKYSKPGKELSADAYVSQRTLDELVNYNEQQYINLWTVSSALPMLKRNNTDGINNFVSANVDYTDSIFSKIKLEAGYKGTISANDADFLETNFDDITQEWKTNAIASSRFIYTEHIEAAYGILTGQFKKVSWQAGIRTEGAFTQGELTETGFSFNKTRITAYPSAFVLYPLDTFNSVKANYSRRVNRPSIMVVNPFINYADPKNLSAGNPNIEPEFVNSYELAHIWKRKNNSIVTNLYFKQTNDVITGITTVNGAGNTYTTFKNQNQAINTGVDLSVSSVIYHFIRLTVSGSGYYIEVKGPEIDTENDHAYSWQAKVNLATRIPKVGDLQIMYNYMAPTLSMQSGSESRHRFMSGGGVGMQASNAYVDLGFKREFMKGKFALLLKVQDLFQSQIFDINTSTPVLDYHLVRTRKSRILFVGVQYRINDYKRKEQRQMESGGGEDM